MSRMIILHIKNQKWKLSEFQLSLMEEISENPHLLWDRIDGNQKVTCRSLEKVGIVDRHPSGKLSLTPKGGNLLEVYLENN